MYAKLVSFSDTGNVTLAHDGRSEVVPRDNTIYEGIRFRYRKICGHSVDDIQAQATALAAGNVGDLTTVGTPAPYVEQMPTVEKFEAIYLEYDRTRVEGSTVDSYGVVAFDHALYIMSDVGKTLDSLVCLVKVAESTLVGSNDEHGIFVADTKKSTVAKKAKQNLGK